MINGEMKHEMTFFHTMGPNRNVLFQIYLLFVTIYGLMWSSFNIRGQSLITARPTLSSNATFSEKKFTIYTMRFPKLV